MLRPTGCSLSSSAGAASVLLIVGRTVTLGSPSQLQIFRMHTRQRFGCLLPLSSAGAASVLLVLGRSVTLGAPSQLQIFRMHTRQRFGKTAVTSVAPETVFLDAAEGISFFQLCARSRTCFRHQVFFLDCQCYLNSNIGYVFINLSHSLDGKRH